MAIAPNERQTLRRPCDQLSTPYACRDAIPSKPYSPQSLPDRLLQEVGSNALNAGVKSKLSFSYLEGKFLVQCRRNQYKCLAVSNRAHQQPIVRAVFSKLRSGPKSLDATSLRLDKFYNLLTPAVDDGFEFSKLVRECNL